MQADATARAELLEQFNESDYEYVGGAVRDMEVVSLSVSTARRYISAFHYSRVMPDSTIACYGGFIGGVLCGIVCYGVGGAKGEYTSLVPKIRDGEYLELTRLWCVNSYPRNTESKLISESLRLLPKRVRLVVSYADSSKGHCGIIYQATNWLYLGMTAGGKAVVKDGVQNRSNLMSVYKKRHPDRFAGMTNAEIAEALGYEYIEVGKKHRYVYLRGTKRERKRMFEQIKHKIEPYPKCDKPKAIGEAEIASAGKGERRQLSLF